MVIRFLFCLTGSLVSGSAVAVISTAVVQYVFPDTADYQKPPSIALAAPQVRPPAGIPGTADPSKLPHPAALTAASPALARSSEAIQTAQETPVAARQSTAQAAGLQPQPVQAALAQAGAQSKEELLSASAPPDLLAHNDRQIEERTTLPDRLMQQDEMTQSISQTAEASAKGQDPPAPGSGSQQESPGDRPMNASDAPSRAAAGSRPTRGRSVHAHRRQPGHATDHRHLIRQAQRQVQE